MGKKGIRFFKAMAFLMIIGGAAGMISGVVAVLGAGALAAALGDSARFGLLMLGSIAVWAGGVTGLIAGVIGVRNAAKPEKAMGAIVFGSLTAALTALGNILAVAGGGRPGAVTLASGLALPVLYLIGALRRKSGAP